MYYSYGFNFLFYLILKYSSNVSTVLDTPVPSSIYLYETLNVSVLGEIVR